MRSKVQKRRPTRSRKVTAAAKRKVVIDFPQDLFAQTERVAGELAVDRSSLIRAAVETYIRELDRKHLERELIEGYTANAKSARATANEMMSAESEFA